MAGKELSDAEIRARIAVWERYGRSQRAAAKELGVSRSTISDTIRIATLREIIREPIEEIELPTFPADDIPINNVLDTIEERFVLRQASHEAHTWFPVKVKGNKPIGILWFGDPHIDDNGCNMPALRRHAELCRTIPGLYGANIGDSTNNWAGRLVRLYANQDTSVKTARRLVQWFMLEAGIRWIVFLLGNHDTWGDGAEILAMMGRQFGTQKIICHDWEARFHLSFPNGWEPRIYAAHNFPGHSQWNPLHGPMKEGMMGQSADLYVCGDRHNWACMTFENPHKRAHQTFIRVRGYKFMDDYARRLGKPEQQDGCSILTVFDPRDQSVLYFENVEKGADYLTKLRG